MSRNTPSPIVDICLISAGLPSSNPRLVKEAKALTSEGFRVHCIVGDYDTPLRDSDAELIRSAGATMTKVGLGSRFSYKLRRAVQVASELLVNAVRSDRLLAAAASPQALRLADYAVQIPARLYIGHTLPALPAAVLAAESRNGLAGFDAEDCHSIESGDVRQNRVARIVEQRFLPRCRHLTASSPLIAEEYQRLYGLQMTPILNVFDAPPSSMPLTNTDSRRRSGPLSLYWFSQTTGPGRGLEQLIAGVGLAKSDVQLCFRGIVSDAYRRELSEHGRKNSLAREIRFLEPTHPDSMIEMVAEHDVGLSLELPVPPNRNLALTNKLFTYLAGGIPQIISRTAAQAAIAAELGEAASLVDLSCPQEIAAAIDRLADEAVYRRAAGEARRLRQSRYSWVIESQALVSAVRQVIAPSGPGKESIQGGSGDDGKAFDIGQARKGAALT